MFEDSDVKTEHTALLHIIGYYICICFLGVLCVDFFKHQQCLKKMMLNGTNKNEIGLSG